MWINDQQKDGNIDLLKILLYLTGNDIDNFFTDENDIKVNQDIIFDMYMGNGEWIKYFFPFFLRDAGAVIHDPDSQVKSRRQFLQIVLFQYDAAEVDMDHTFPVHNVVCIEQNVIQNMINLSGIHNGIGQIFFAGKFKSCF